MYKWKLMENAITFTERIKIAFFAMTTKQFTSGRKVVEFENRWSQWLGCKHSLFVSSGSTANLLLVSAIMEKYGLKRGDKVLLPACTWTTNVTPAIQLGLEPVFCDINLKDFSFDVDNLKEIAKTHSDIKLIFVTHLLGFPAKNHLYKEIFPNAIIIDDVCESHGAKFEDGTRVGQNSLGATFSFYFGHHMTTIEGGMVSTNDTELYDIMKMKRSHGLARESIFFEEYSQKYPNIDKKFLFITDGYNFRNHEICAVIGMSQLKKLDGCIEKRRRNYKKFLSVMKKYEDIFYMPEDDNGNSNFCFPLIAKERNSYEKLVPALEKNLIEYRPVVAGNLMCHPFLSKYKIESSKPIYNADILQQNGLYLGNNQFIEDKNIKMLDGILGDLYGSR